MPFVMFTSISHILCLVPVLPVVCLRVFKFRSYWWLCLCLPVFNDPERLCIPILWYFNLPEISYEVGLQYNFTSISHRLCLVPVLPVVCLRVHVLFTLIVCVCAWWCPTYIVLCVCFVLFRLVYPKLSASLDCHLWIANRLVCQTTLARLLCLAESVRVQIQFGKNVSLL
jgi:hypothetical protein